VPSRPEPADADAASARIDADAEAEAEAPSDAIWEVVPNYQNVEEGDSTWTLKARDQAALDKARQLITDALNAAAQMSSVGFLTLSDRSMFPRIVGSKGSNVARLRNETGADITVSRENSTIVIMGSETDIVAAKDAILKMSSTPSGRSQRRHS